VAPVLVEPTDEVLAVRVEPRTGSVELVASGELDMANAADFLDAGFVALELAARRGVGVACDLAMVSFCDSAGMRVLVTIVEEARTRRVPVSFVAVHDRVLQVAGLLGLTDLITS
jgi:anti-anti-sigma factor